MRARASRSADRSARDLAQHAEPVEPEDLLDVLRAVAAAEEAVDPKSRLQELAQARWKETPRYRLVATRGPDHAREFVVEVWIQGRRWALGQGGSRKEAERDAARAALRALGEQVPATAPAAGPPPSR